MKGLGIFLALNLKIRRIYVIVSSISMHNVNKEGGEIEKKTHLKVLSKSKS